MPIWYRARGGERLRDSRGPAVFRPALIQAIWLARDAISGLTTSAEKT